MITNQYHVVTYNDFYDFMTKVTGCSREELYSNLSYNDSYFENYTAQFIEVGHDFTEAMEECNREIALHMNKALDEFLEIKDINSILLI